MAGVRVGYARTSTADQQAGLEAQVRDLKIVGCSEIFTEQVSALAQRDQLREAMRFLRKDDTLVVTKPDRLARSTADLLAIVGQLEAKDVGLLVLSMGGQTLDTRSPTSKLMLVTLGAVAEFERSLLIERQREGIRKAALAGKYKGRKPTAMAKATEVRAMDAMAIPRAEIARRCGISVASVYRIVGAAKNTAAQAA
jgi:DNA invertase Pin-like site-specific DNA recombinase